MNFRAEIIQEITDRIVQLGLSACPVCGSASSMGASHKPVILPIGGVPWPGQNRPDPMPGSNILFMVRISCEVCGHTMLFDSEKFHDGDTPVLEAE